MCRTGNLKAFSINYRLAPENQYPCALDDCVDAYRWLIDPKGGNINPANVIIGGDSAGGGLAISTLLKLSKENIPLPSGIILFSPWLDISQSLDSWERYFYFMFFFF
jgi:monoterpene epsilon-lactone hydrolase